MFFYSASGADAAAINSNTTKTLLANGVSSFFLLMVKHLLLMGQKKLGCPPCWLLFFLAVSFNKISLSSTDFHYIYNIFLLHYLLVLFRKPQLLRASFYFFFTKNIKLHIYINIFRVFFRIIKTFFELIDL